MQRIATISPVFGGKLEDLRTVAHLAEDAGFEAVFSPEVPAYSAIANAQVFSECTSRIKVGTWITNIYMRLPIMAAAEAMTVQEISDGRMVLGLGISHKPVNDRFGIEMGDPIEAMRKYVTEIRSYFDGSSEKLTLKRDLPPVPIYIAGLTEKTAELAGEAADGIMSYIASPAYVAKIAAGIKRGAQKQGRFASEVDITNGIPTFISDDLEAAYKTATMTLGAYARFPFYQRMIANNGFPEIPAKIKEGTKPAEALTNEFLDTVSLIGPASRCREKLEEYREAGLRMPIIVPSAVGKQPYPEVIKTVVEAFGE